MRCSTLDRLYKRMMAIGPGARAAKMDNDRLGRWRPDLHPVDRAHSRRDLKYMRPNSSDSTAGYGTPFRKAGPMLEPGPGPFKRGPIRKTHIDKV